MSYIDATLQGLVNPFLVIVVGSIGLIINLVGLFMFYDSAEDITDDNKTNNLDDTRQYSSAMNIRGVFLHILADALGSVVVIITATVISYAPAISGSETYKLYIDPVLSLLLVAFILTSAWPLLKRSALTLLKADV